MQTIWILSLRKIICFVGLIDSGFIHNPEKKRDAIEETCNVAFYDAKQMPNTKFSCDDIWYPYF